MKYIYLTFIILAFGFKLNAQCIETNTAFKTGEKLTYTGYYNWGFLWVSAGKVELKVDNAKYKNKDVFKFKALGRSAKAFDWFFKLRDTLTCYANKENMKPYFLHRQTNEAKYKADHKYSFDYQENKIYSVIQKRNKDVKIDTIPLTPCSFDLLSIAYHTRNINFDEHKIGDKIPIHMLIDNEIHKLYIRFKGYDVIKTKKKKKYPCIKFSPLLVKGTMFEDGEGMTIWLSNDKNKIPIMVEAKIIVGSVKGILSSYEGLRHKSHIFQNNNKGTIEIEE